MATRPEFSHVRSLAHEVNSEGRRVMEEFVSIVKDIR